MSKTIPEEPMLSKMPINCGSCNRMIQMYKAEKTDFHTWNTIKSPGSTKTGFMRRIMSEEKVKRDVSKIYKSDANISKNNSNNISFKDKDIEKRDKYKSNDIEKGYDFKITKHNFINCNDMHKK